MIGVIKNPQYGWAATTSQDVAFSIVDSTSWAASDPGEEWLEAYFGASQLFPAEGELANMRLAVLQSKVKKARVMFVLSHHS